MSDVGVAGDDVRGAGGDASRATAVLTSLRSATETRPDAIVLDINMPVLDGVSVVTALRAMENDVPVCVLSARSSVDDRVAGLGVSSCRSRRSTSRSAVSARAPKLPAELASKAWPCCLCHRDGIP